MAKLSDALLPKRKIPKPYNPQWNLLNGVDRMRNQIALRYPHSQRWHTKVAGMPEKQVMAIYFKMKARGEL